MKNSEISNEKYLKLVRSRIAPFLIIAIIAGLRSPELFRHLIIYTEDGLWSGLASQHGWLWTYLNAKPGYFVIGNILLLQIASTFSHIFASQHILYLAFFVATIGFLIYVVVSYFVYLYFSNRYHSKFIALGIAAIFTLLPYGTSTNEIIGRISNIGYFALPLTVLLLLNYDNILRRLNIFVFNFFLLILELTNPISSLSIFFLYFGNKIYSKTNSRIHKSTYVISIFTLIANIVRSVMHQQNMITGHLEYPNIIKVFVGRSLLYPLVFPIYSKLNDLMALLIFALLMYFCVRKYNQISKSEKAGVLLVACTLFANIILTAYSRPSLTQQITNYQITFPDRYFIGSNFLILLLVFQLLIFKKYKSQKRRRQKFGQTRDGGTAKSNPILIGFILVELLLFSLKGFEFSTTKFPIYQGLTFNQQVCNAKMQKNKQNAYIDIPIYFDGWSIQLKSNELSKVNC